MEELEVEEMEVPLEAPDILLVLLESLTPEEAVGEEVIMRHLQIIAGAQVSL
jgi:hypothetical protein